MRGLPWTALAVVAGIAACGYPPLRPLGGDAGVDAGPMVTCVASSLPLTTSTIYLRDNAPGRKGTDNGCPQIGESFTSTNPQHVWCRRMGGEVRSSDGLMFNHYWIWTNLDVDDGTYPDPRGTKYGLGWISAYYISGQNNDEAIGIPDCPSP